jgi:hypothetical protein
MAKIKQAPATIEFIKDTVSWFTGVLYFDP